MFLNDTPSTIRSKFLNEWIIVPTIHPMHTEPYENDILLTPRTYQWKYLYKWQSVVPTVPHNTDGFGEMGKLYFFLQIHAALSFTKS